METLLFEIGELLQSLWLPIAHAQEDPCYLIGGCNSSENPLPPFGQAVTHLLIYVGAGLCMLFCVWGGAQVMLSFGEDSRMQSGRMSIIYAVVGFVIILAGQTIVAAVTDWAYNVPGSENPILGTIETVIEAMLYLFNITFIIIFIYSGFRLVIGRGRSDVFDEVWRSVAYAILGAIFVNLSKSIVAAIFNLGI